MNLQELREEGVELIVVEGGIAKPVNPYPHKKVNYLFKSKGYKLVPKLNPDWLRFHNKEISLKVPEIADGEYEIMKFAELLNK